MLDIQVVLSCNRGMEYERVGLLLPETTKDPVDISLIDSFNLAHQNLRETYTDLAVSDRKKQLAMESWPLGQNADLTAGSLNIDDLNGRKSAFKTWKKELIDNEGIDLDIKQLYRWRINEDIANIGMLIASRAGDMPNFRRWNEFIYGKPNEEIYKAALDWVSNDAKKLLSVENQKPAVIEAAEKVVNMLNGKTGNLNILVPDKGVFEKVREDHMRPMGYYGLLLAGVELPKDKINNEIGDPIIKTVLANNLESGYGVKNADGASWSVSHLKGEEAVKRPKTYNLPHQRFLGLALGHEIGSHLLEKVNGERGPLALSSIGLDRYEAGNEGRAVIREQVVYDAFEKFAKLPRWRDIMRRHIAISYACGIGEDEPRGSVDVYNFMNTIDTMYQTKISPDEPDVTKQKSGKKTTDLLFRVLKGTDGNGGAYLKDKVYLEGVVASWLTATVEGVDFISSGDLGKFDINNPRHIIALQKLGLLPDRD